jgi:hypothetical protein
MIPTIGAGRCTLSLAKIQFPLKQLVILYVLPRLGLHGGSSTMRGSWGQDEFPQLNDTNGLITSPPSRRYNCIAWAAGNNTQWWWPDAAMIAQRLCYWPPNAPIDLTFDAFLQAYGTLGYQQCQDGALEPGFEKIALYGQRNASGSIEPTHAALQLPDGRWTSKLGSYEDVEHDTTADIDCPAYGKALYYMRR